MDAGSTPRNEPQKSMFDLCSLEEIKRSGGMAFSFRHKERGNHDVGLFWDGTDIYAIDNWCPHADGFLHEGEISEKRVICPIHHAIFDLTNGRCTNHVTWDVRYFKTEIIDGRVWIDLPDEESGTRVLRRS